MEQKTPSLHRWQKCHYELHLKVQIAQLPIQTPTLIEPYQKYRQELNQLTNIHLHIHHHFWTQEKEESLSLNRLYQRVSHNKIHNPSLQPPSVTPIIIISIPSCIKYINVIGHRLSPNHYLITRLLHAFADSFFFFSVCVLHISSHISSENASTSIHKSI